LVHSTSQPLRYNFSPSIIENMSGKQCPKCSVDPVPSSSNQPSVIRTDEAALTHSET